MSNLSTFTKIKDAIAKQYGKNPGTMLIHTGVISWILSSAAQVVAIMINDKIPKEQKMFLIPQEMADAAVNIASFYMITQSFATLSKQLVETGKWLPKSVRTYLASINFKNIGKLGTNIAKDVELPEKLALNYKQFYDGIDVTATTIGSILSCNIVTPLIRNEIAAHRQKKSLEQMRSMQDVSNINTVKVENKSYLPKPSMLDFQSRAFYVYPNSSSLKI